MVGLQVLLVLVVYNLHLEADLRFSPIYVRDLFVGIHQREEPDVKRRLLTWVPYFCVVCRLVCGGKSPSPPN